MSVHDLDRVALRALDPASVHGLSKTQRDTVAEAIIAAFQARHPCRAYGAPCESAVYLRVPAAQK